MEYSSNRKRLVPLGDSVKELPAVTGLPAMIVLRTKAPLWNVVEAVETEVGLGKLLAPELTAVTIGGVATPETSYAYASMTMWVPGIVIVIVSDPLEARVA